MPGVSSAKAPRLGGLRSGEPHARGAGLAAREQQLREKELDVAYDLARKNAAARLTLRIHLNELHLDRPTRARLEAELAGVEPARTRHAFAHASRRRRNVVAISQQSRAPSGGRHGPNERTAARQSRGESGAARPRIAGRLTQLDGRSFNSDRRISGGLSCGRQRRGDRLVVYRFADRYRKPICTNRGWRAPLARRSRSADREHRSRTCGVTSSDGIANRKIVRRLAEQRHLAVGRSHRGRSPAAASI